MKGTDAQQQNTTYYQKEVSVYVLEDGRVQRGKRKKKRIVAKLNSFLL